MQTLAQIIQSGEKTTPTANSCSNSNSATGETNFNELLTRFSDVDFSTPVEHCDNCKTPTQKDIHLLGVQHRVPVQCKCRIAAYEREKKEAEHRDLQRRLERFRAYSLMDDRFEASTFESWEHRSDNKQEYALGVKYCENWDTMYANNRGLLLYGPAGNGKTFLSFAIANALYKQGRAVMAVSIMKLLAAIKDSFDKHGEIGEADVFNTVRDASLLVLDDLGVEYKTAWAYEKLYAIIDTRYRANKPTIITTNLSLDALRENFAIVDIKSRAKDPSERIFSRITEMCVFHEMKGASWRISKGAKNKAQFFNEIGLQS